MSKFKRIHLDTEGQELGAKGRSKIAGLDISQKVKALHFISNLMVPIYKKAEVNFMNTEAAIDLGLDAQLTNLAFSLHQAERQRMNTRGGSGASRKFFGQQAASVEVHGQTYTFVTTTLDEYYKNAMTTLAFTEANKEEWSGNMQTLFALLSMFSERLKEVRIMPTGMVASKGLDGTQSFTKTMDFKSLGVMPQHRQFRCGAAWQPFMKSALAQSLGPLTQACMLTMAKDDKYANKWEMAVRRTFSYVPDIEHISRIMKESNATQERGIITRLANLIMLVGGREQRRVSLPVCSWMYLVMKRTMGEKNVEILEFDEDAAAKYDFSGKGAFAGYKHLSEQGPLYTLNVLNRHFSQQLMFHAVFGTYVEDFGVLCFITDKADWATRREIDSAFAKLR
ncbi:unnamed protein product, partial [Ixodes persulcatus]